MASLPSQRGRHLMNFSWLAHGAILCARFGDHKASTVRVPHLWRRAARDELGWRVGPRCYSPLASASPTVDTFQVSAPLTATPLRHCPLVQSHLVTRDNTAPPLAGGDWFAMGSCLTLGWESRRSPFPGTAEVQPWDRVLLLGCLIAVSGPSFADK